MEEDYADIIYVDTRNAVTRDNRTGQRPSPFFPRRPVPQQTPYAPPSRVPHIPAPGYQPAPVYTQPQVIYAPAPPMHSSAAALFGKFTTGQLVELGAQIFAALQNLPGAPIATREVETDVANLILYQNALANHAKRDEQVRTLGSLVARLVG